MVLVDVDPKDPGTLADQGSSLPPSTSTSPRREACPLRSCVWRGLLPFQPACGPWIAKSPSEGKAFWPAIQQEGTRGLSSKTPRTKNRYRHQNASCKPHVGPSQPRASSGNTSRLSSWGRHAVRTLTWQRRNHPLLFLLPPPGPPTTSSTQAFVQTGKAPLPPTFHCHLLEGCHMCWCP